METKHTPTPFTLNPDERPNLNPDMRGTWESWRQAIYSERFPYKQIGWAMGNSHDETEANIVFILRACNSYDDLLTELDLADKIIGILLNALPQEEGQPTRREVYAKLCALHDGEGVVRSEERRAAIAKAEGRA